MSIFRDEFGGRYLSRRLGSLFPICSPLYRNIANLSAVRWRDDRQAWSMPSCAQLIMQILTTNNSLFSDQSSFISFQRKAINHMDTALGSGSINIISTTRSSENEAGKLMLSNQSLSKNIYLYPEEQHLKLKFSTFLDFLATYKRPLNLTENFCRT